MKKFIRIGDHNIFAKHEITAVSTYQGPEGIYVSVRLRGGERQSVLVRSFDEAKEFIDDLETSVDQDYKELGVGNE